MNRVLVVFSDGLLSELDSARGLVSRSAWIRQAVEDKLMKEAVAPLVPVTPQRIWKATDVEWQAFKEGAGFSEDRYPDAIREPKSKARRKKSVKDSPAANRSEVRQGGLSFPTPTESPSLPARCNRGACTGTINPVSGRCLRCNQTPLKESK